jgi:hypothetical protein
MYENNRYYQHRHEIKAACDDLDVPVDIGSDIVRKRHNWGTTGAAGRELTEWRNLCRSYQLDKEKTLADLFV